MKGGLSDANHPEYCNQCHGDKHTDQHQRIKHECRNPLANLTKDNAEVDAFRCDETTA